MKAAAVTTCRAGRLRVHVLSFLVWLAAVAAVAVLFRHRAARFEILGLAQGQAHQVAANCDGRLKTIHVQLFERITRGRELVTINTILDNQTVQAQLSTAQAEVQHLTAQLAATRQRLLAEAANLQTDKVVSLRRFSADMENARLGVLQLKTQLKTDQMLLEEQAVEVKIVRSLVEQDAVAPYELQKAEARYATTAKRIEENEDVLQQAVRDYIEANTRLEEFAGIEPQHPAVDIELEIIQKAITVQEKRIDELLARTQPLVLKSPLDGVVSFIARGPEEAVMAGDPILTIVAARPAEIIAYAGQDQLKHIRERMPVELARAGEPTKIATSQVVYLGPRMELMPERLWRNPNIPQWGRPMLIKVPPGLELVCDEVVAIRGL
ncbi:MAG TPA: HlyD family efflux transporter periplasmic adaptor subunit [Sedimentisphaerales bacterium]|nr:HlyD family efflux transporter periplasmic adaptor subunit [Sedimentisphaerales bacterium]